jgi:rhodanese-related sulfurtransferase
MSEGGRDLPPGVTPISRSELVAKLDEHAVVLVDAQAPRWFEREHLPSALCANARDIDDLVDRLAAAPTEEIVVCCWSEMCDASARVSAELAARGFSNVRRYIEGKRDWLDAGLPVEGGQDTRPIWEGRD